MIQKQDVKRFLLFGLVGASGTVVNLVVIYMCTQMVRICGADEYSILLRLYPTLYNVRYYHIIMTVGFVVSCFTNYILNRKYTFHYNGTFWMGFMRFLLTGIGAFIVTQILATLLINPISPISLPDNIFDNSSGLRNKFYYASAISIMIAMPINYIISKLWTFKKQP